MLTSRIRYALRVWALGICLVSGVASEVRAEDGSKEAVFSALSFKLLSFVNRNGESLDAADRVIRIGVYDRGRKVFKVLEEKCRENPQRYVLVDLTKELETEETLDMVYISGESGRRLARVLSAFDEKSVLTVGDDEDLLKLGGIVRFSISRTGRPVYSLNLKQAKEVGLKINSRLANKAAEVIR